MSATDVSPIDVQAMRHAANDAGALLRILSNTNRLLLMCQLSQGEKSVGHLEELLNIHQPTLSQQLGILRQVGLVKTRREGKQIIYRVGNDKVLQMLHLLQSLYCPKHTE